MVGVLGREGVMTYLWLVLAIAFEVGWAVTLKLSKGFAVLGPSLATVVLYLLSVLFLALAAKKMELSIAYGLWTGSGAALVAAIAMVYFKEPVSVGKIVSIGLIVAGIVGLGIAEASGPKQQVTNQQSSR